MTDKLIEAGAEWFALAMNAAASLEDAACCLSDSEAKAAALGAAKHVREKCNSLWDVHRSQQEAAQEPDDYQDLREFWESSASECRHGCKMMELKSTSPAPSESEALGALRELLAACSSAPESGGDWANWIKAEERARAALFASGKK